ncbi:hypothetical protein C9374_000081 [Naegleria lovaniensis]|uniref:Coiled-coil domain-containing protein 189 n=1 Tax=Naegleria lovaniensis TaxID=51637 RepID=A0AA88GTK9_NAELO|nr:uncharacterized protein C9374_000081 [Naegleria lovaniensis]KAG2388642.1 hypothetical protein C9374_000081 [Naegleria lovaniensis]
MLWQDITAEQIQSVLSDVSNVEDLKQNMNEVLDLYELYPNLSVKQYEILSDLFMHTIMFCMRNRFTLEKISALFTIVKEIHKDTSNNDISLYDSFVHFKQLVTKYSVHRPPFSIEVFHVDDVKKISEYVYNTFYRHYKMYQYVFCPKQTASVTIVPSPSQLILPKPFEMLGLGKAMTQQEFQEKKQQQQLADDTKAKQNTTTPQATPRVENNEQPIAKEEAPQSETSQKKQPPHPQILKQLEPIKKEIEEMTQNRISELESRISELEQMVAEKKPLRHQSNDKTFH